jgi:ABC-type sugar transport system ATPase subunit
MVSGDHEQLAHTCNRVFVLRDGRIVDEQAGDAMSEETLIAACNRVS